MSVVVAIFAISVGGDAFVYVVFVDRRDYRLVAAITRIWGYQGQTYVGGGGKGGSRHAQQLQTGQLHFRGEQRLQPNLLYYHDHPKYDPYLAYLTISKQKPDYPVTITEENLCMHTLFYLYVNLRRMSIHAYFLDNRYYAECLYIRKIMVTA